jgi:hypothetical protein
MKTKSLKFCQRFATVYLACWTLLLSAQAATRYVNVNNLTPVSPYTNWTSAATNIQDAVDAASTGDLILVTNGAYQTGGRVIYGSMTNRVAVNKSVTVSSVNGPGVTTIKGYQVPGTTNGDAAIRCVYLAYSAKLLGFTLTNGATRVSGDYQEYTGGGVFCNGGGSVVSNCIITGNSADGGGGAIYGTLKNCILAGNHANSGGGGAYLSTLTNCTLMGNAGSSFGGGVIDCTLNNCTLTGNSADSGGGACGGTLNNCTLTGNLAFTYGGGTYQGSLNNCTLTSNSAVVSGGGAAGSKMTNCIVYYNIAQGSQSNYYGGTLNYCSTIPLPIGIGNITNAPLFVNQAGGNLHLQSGSPCINAGLNSAAPGSVDLDGNPRIVGGIVDMGAYESSVIPPIIPQFTFCRYLTNAVALQLSGEIGRVFEIQTSTNLTSWLWLVTLTNNSSLILYTNTGLTGQPIRFYRAIQLP